MRLLSVDWDFFFVDPIGGPPTWVPEFKDGKIDFEETQFKSWLSRATTWTKNGARLPETSGEEREFWARFRFAAECSLFTAEDHRFAAEPVVTENITEVWNFDAHHDAGYERQPGEGYADENWLMAYADNVTKYVRYPRWKKSAFDLEPHPLIEVNRKFDDGLRSERVFDRVFICRSHGFVPPWLDADYRDFVNSCPTRLERSWPLIPREGIGNRVKSELENRR